MIGLFQEQYAEEENVSKNQKTQISYRYNIFEKRGFFKDFFVFGVLKCEVITY